MWLSLGIWRVCCVMRSAAASAACTRCRHCCCSPTSRLRCQAVRLRHAWQAHMGGQQGGCDRPQMGERKPNVFKSFCRLPAKVAHLVCSPSKLLFAPQNACRLAATSSLVALLEPAFYSAWHCNQQHGSSRRQRQAIPIDMHAVLCIRRLFCAVAFSLPHMWGEHHVQALPGPE